MIGAKGKEHAHQMIPYTVSADADLTRAPTFDCPTLGDGYP